MSSRKQFFILFFSCLIHSCRSTCVPSSSQCGCSPVKPILSKTKIIGGYTARTNSWPWMVSLRRLKDNASFTSVGSHFCGGALISDKYVLTAAHCVNGVKSSQLENYFVVVGAQYRNDTNQIRLTIKSMIIHNKYNSDTYENDIALLELTYRVDLSDPKIGFICLPLNNVVIYPYVSMNATTIGWGRLEAGGISSYALQQVQLPIIANTNQYCQNIIYNDTIQFCAGFVEGGKDTCQGDSGGPLLIYNADSDTWNIAGVTSYGYGCALPEYPGIYTRVSMFVNWINARMNGENSESQASLQLTSNKVLLFVFCMSLFFLQINYPYF